MCRMFLLKGDFQKNFPEIFNISKKISAQDPLHSLDSSLPYNHIDGWGYVNLTQRDIYYYRTSVPLADSDEPKVNDGYLLFHMRNAAPGEPMGVNNSHPFHISTEDGDFYLSHNGWFDKKKIAEYIHLRNYQMENDSLVFLRFLASQSGTIEEKVKSAIEISRAESFVKSTANLLLLFVDKGENITGIAFTDASPSTRYGKYHELFLIETKEWKGVFSSSFLEFDFISRIGKISKLERGKLYYI